MATVVKNSNVITITLDTQENKVVNYFINRGTTWLSDAINGWLKGRKDTFQASRRESLIQQFELLTPAQKADAKTRYGLDA